MSKKSSKKIWIFIAIFAIIAFTFSFGNCFSNEKQVETSEVREVVEYIGSNYGTRSGFLVLTDFKNLSDNEIIKTLQDYIINAQVTDSSRIYVDSLYIDAYKISFTMKMVSGQKVNFFTYFGRTNLDEWESILVRAGIDFDYSNPNAGSLLSSLLPLVGTLLIAIVFFILINNSQGGAKGAMNFGKTNARVSNSIKVRFTDVAGAEEEKAELAEVVDFLKNPKKFSELGARVPKGVLLVGPPGTGKTLFAKAVAGEAGVPFFSISGSDFVEMFVGVGASRVRDLFDMAKKSMPCIVFIDEIDAVGRQRGAGLGGGNDEREQTLNQLLVQMDGFETNTGIIIMAATNRADILDPALMRPGRFDRQIYVNVPDVRGREAILKVHARNKPLAPDVNFKTVARMTSGFSGADLENVLNEAAILAARANRKAITNKDLYEGINKVILGPQKKSRLVTETDKRITAYHEAGHAILARLLPHCDPVHEVSIIPRGQAAGYTMTRPENDDNHLTKAKLLDDIVMTMGGRVAEELIIKDISAGASGDIAAVTKRARLMVTEWGMSEKVGTVSYSSGSEVFIGRDYATHVNYSDKTAAVIDEEVQRIITEGLEKARTLLAKNKKLLDVMARVLIERETIFTEEVELIMKGCSAEEVVKFMDENEHVLSNDPFNRNTNPTIIKNEEKAEEPKKPRKPRTTKPKVNKEEPKEETAKDVEEKTEETESNPTEKSEE